MKKTTFLLVHLWAALGVGALAFAPPPAQAAVTEAWVHRYSNVVSNSYDQAFKVVLDPAGNVVVTGYSYNTNNDADYCTGKYAAGDGALLWEQRYNGPANSDDHATAVAVDGRGNVVVTGSSYNTMEPATTTGPSMRRRTERCFGRNATTARRTTATPPRRWRWTATAM